MPMMSVFIDNDNYDDNDDDDLIFGRLVPPFHSNMAPVLNSSTFEHDLICICMMMTILMMMMIVMMIVKW